MLCLQRNALVSRLPTEQEETQQIHPEADDYFNNAKNVGNLPGSPAVKWPPAAGPEKGNRSVAHLSNKTPRHQASIRGFPTKTKTGPYLPPAVEVRNKFNTLSDLKEPDDPSSSLTA